VDVIPITDALQSKVDEKWTEKGFKLYQWLDSNGPFVGIGIVNKNTNKRDESCKQVVKHLVNPVN
jgi:hypothetical protein